MVYNVPSTLPVINFCQEDLIPGSCEWNSVKIKVLQALGEYGCFEALFNKVPVKVQNEIFGELEQLFDLPLEVKQSNISETPFKGYIANSPYLPLFECISLFDAHVLENVESLTHIFWPQGNPNFSKTIQSFAERVLELDRTIRRMILESFGLGKYIDEHLNSTQYDFRMNKYKAPQTSTETEFGVMPHKDQNFITILSQNQVDGLEVQSTGGEWIQVKPSSPNSYIVLTGASLYAWLNGRLHPANHRVMMSGSEARYSIGLFSNPKAGYIVKATEEQVDEEHPLLFKPFEYAEFLKFLSSEAGRKAESALEAYCGL